MSYINKINRNNTDYPLVALNSIVTTTSTIDTQIKVGSLDGFTLTNTNQSFKLYLPNGNSVADMKLNLNNLGAKDIKIYKGGVLGSIATTIDVGTIMELFYDGTQFIVIGNPIAQTTSDYTVLMDNTLVYNKSGIDSVLNNYQKRALLKYYFNTSSPTFTVNLSQYKTYTSGYRSGFKVRIFTYSGSNYYECYIIGNTTDTSLIISNNRGITCTLNNYTLSVAISGTPYDVNVLIEY